MAKVFALDQNFFRSGELESLIAADPTAKFVVLDIALLEMAKGDEWMKIMRRSLEILSKRPGRILASISLGEALRYELETLDRAPLNMICKESTRYVRALATELAANDPAAPTIRQFRARLPAVQNDLSHDELDHSKNLKRLQDMTAKVKAFLKPAGMKVVKQPDFPTIERLALVYFIASILAKDELVARGHLPVRVKRFLKGNPLYFRYYLTLVRHGLEWAIKGGIENYTPQKATNDTFDQEYVVAGSFFDDLLSCEKRVIVANQELRFMLSIKNPGGITLPFSRAE